MLWASANKRRALYAELVRTHLDSLHRTAVRLTGNPTDADDLVQETFLRAWRNLDQLREPAGARAWLFCLLRSAFIDDVRKAARRAQSVPLEEIAEPAAPVPVCEHHERLALEEHFDEAVLRALDELPEPERLALMFQTCGGLSYREISEALDCPLGTVMSRLHRAKSALRRRLADYERRRGIGSERSEGDGRAQA